MARWNLGEMRDLIQRLYGWDQVELARPALQSVIDRRDYAYYHYHEANDLFLAFAQEHLAEESLMWVVYQSDESFSEFHWLMTRIGAHVVACIQSLHAIPDIMAHAVYYSLGLNLSGRPLREAAISATTVLEKLSQSTE